jgi:hypothetical protein
MAPEGKPMSVEEWGPLSRPRAEKKRGDLSPTIFFLPAYLMARLYGLVDEDGYEIE